MKRSVIRFLILLFIFQTGTLYSQDINARSPKPSPAGKQQQAADKKKAQKQKKIAKGNARGVKRHEKLQAKNTKKMMKKSKRTAKRNNEHKKEFFLKRWFTKSHH